MAAGQATETLYLKVHEMWYRTDRGEPLFPPEVTQGVVYLVRNPIDLVSSFANHSLTDHAAATELVCQTGSSRWRQDRALGMQLPQRLGSWSEHVRSWTEEAGVPVCVVRYEDLLDEPAQTFTRALYTCGLEPDALCVEKAVAFSRFEELRRQEAEHGFREMLSSTRELFFRRGEAGRGRSELGPALVHAIVEAHGETMARLGYLPDNCAGQR
jgi:hypothetical protein